MTTQYSPAWNNASRTQTCIRANVADSGSAANSTLLDLQVNNVSKFTVDKFGELIIAPTARTSGSDALINLVAPADTTRAASTEATDINFNLARTVQFAAGNITDQRAVRIQAPTYSFASASTITNASTLSISGAPVAGTNATITNRHAVNVETGDVKLNSGNLVLADTDGLGNVPAKSNILLKRRLVMAGRDNYFTNMIHFGQYACLHGLNANAMGWGYESSVFGWFNGSMWYGKVGQSAGFGFASDIYGPISGFTSLVLHTTLLSSSTNSQTLQIANTFTDASNYERLAFQFGTFSSARHAQIAAESAGTGTANINLVLTPKGTGAFILGPPPDGTATGGNARGANAVDFSTSRTAATQVASGAKSFVGPAGGTASGTSSSVFGPNCTASGNFAGAGGQASSATGQSSFAWGQQVTAAGYGAAAFGEDTATAAAAGFASGKSSSAHSASTRAHAAAHFANRGTGNIRGSSQMIDWTAAASAAPGVETQVFSTVGGTASLSATVAVPDNTVQSGVISIQAVNSSGNSVCHFLRQYAVKRIAGTVSEVYSPVIIGTDSNAAGASIAITADNTAKAIKVTFTAPVATASVTGDAGTDVITSAGHGFTDGQEIAFSNLVGGTGLTNNTLYFVRDATANTFKVTTGFPTNTATNFTTNITSGNVGYMWNVNAAFRMEEVRRGG